MVGSSWGGFDALARLLTKLPPDSGFPVVIAQHRRPSKSSLADSLSRRTGWPVQEVEDKEPIEPGVAYLAPGGYHLLVDRGKLALSTDEPVRHARPSIDVLFESAADAYGCDVVGVVLTGNNNDGADGLAAIVARGGRAVVQDPISAEKPVMPAAALARVPSAEVLGIDQIGPFLADLCQPDGGPLRVQAGAA